MPFRSKAQARWAFATKQTFAKKWAKKTNYSRLPVRAGGRPNKRRTSARKRR